MRRNVRFIIGFQEIWLNNPTVILKLEIGAGESGKVWKATSAVSGKAIALKVYHSKQDGETCDQVLLLSDIIRESRQSEAQCVYTFCSLRELRFMNLKAFRPCYFAQRVPGLSLSGF